jgi:hypothetical protein
LLESGLNRKKGKSSLALFINGLTQEEKEFVVRVGRLVDVPNAGESAEIVNGGSYLERVVSRQEALAKELLGVLRY